MKRHHCGDFCFEISFVSSSFSCVQGILIFSYEILNVISTLIWSRTANVSSFFFSCDGRLCHCWPTSKLVSQLDKIIWFFSNQVRFRWKIVPNYNVIEIKGNFCQGYFPVTFSLIYCLVLRIKSTLISIFIFLSVFFYVSVEIKSCCYYFTVLTKVPPPTYIFNRYTMITNKCLKEFNFTTKTFLFDHPVLLTKHTVSPRLGANNHMFKKSKSKFAVKSFHYILWLRKWKSENLIAKCTLLNCFAG